MVQPPKHQPWVEEGWALRGPDGLPGPLDNQYNRKDYGEEYETTLSRGRRTIAVMEPSSWKSAMPGEPGCLNRLTAMHYDILEEVLRYIGPRDPHRLSWADTSWAKVLANSDSKIIWEDARSLYCVPDPPQGFTERGWAGLLFETVCECCGKNKALEVDWMLLKRICGGCRETQSLTDTFKFKSIHPQEDESVLHYTPHTFLNSRSLHVRQEATMTFRFP
ncbi:hypothetical protein FA13DRAFT_1733308 [Coprinellus micaceus]|uniref:F-box domain-containing protein n=1 Tax=Coprinellus micaceus TaxID=71717 RepID=A0A4Y7T9Q4_COPMI|nr:hypothetical protein FA13DRAFT_1733308 [Coprinellus micaceus]